jgi:hypothetical protein
MTNTGRLAERTQTMGLLCCACCSLFLWAMGCSSECACGEARPAGTEQGPCRADGSCDAPLVCLSDLCVMPSSAGDPDLGSAGSSGNSGGSAGAAAGPVASRTARLDITGSVRAVFWNDSGATAYLAGDTAVHELDMESFAITRTVAVTDSGTTDAWALTGSGPELLLSTSDQVYLKDLATETDQTVIFCNDCSMIPVFTAAAISHDGRWVAATSANQLGVFLHDRTAGAANETFFQPNPNPSRPFRGVAFSADDSQLYVHDTELLYVVRLPELEVERTLSTFPSPTMPSPTGSIVLLPGREVMLQRTESGAALLPLDGSPGTAVHLDYPGSSVAVSRDGTLAAVTTLTYDPTIGSVWVVDLDTLAASRLFTSEPEGERVEAAFVSPDAQYVLAPFGSAALDIYAVD